MASTATRFYRTELIDDVWWLIDPEGAPFLSFGVNHVLWEGDRAPALGHAPYHRQVQAKYGSCQAWAGVAHDRLRAWGFNTIGAWSSPVFRDRGIAHSRILNIGTAAGGRWREGIFPDVFSERFDTATHAAAAEQCGSDCEDRHLLGYFTDNELRWGPDGRSSRSLLADYFALAPDAPGKHELVQLLRQRYGTIDAFNRLWQTSLADFDALRRATDLDAISEPFRAVGREALMHTLAECCPPERVRAYLQAWHGDVETLNAHWRTRLPSLDAAVEPPAPSEHGRERLALESNFLRHVAEAYFSKSARAIRTHDPNHLILGCRFAGSAFAEVVQSMGRHTDVLSYNNYSFKTPVERLAQLHDWTGRPIMITEFSFKAMDSGLPNTHGAGVPVQSQQQRADLYEAYVTDLMKLPFAVGFHWFQHSDQPAEGRFDGENSNYGLVTIDDEPWQTLTERTTRVNRGLYKLHAAAH